MIRRLLVRGALGGALLAAAVAAPVIWTETACRAAPEPQAAARVLTDPADRRPEARSFLVYPEWHIVYAYEELAAALADGAAHDFDYLRSVAGFWSALCAVREEADRFGDPGPDARATIHTIGVSFTVEMAAKAVYEETVGRLAVLWRGQEKSPQDVVEHEMARAYGAFLHQTPWYRFDFDAWTDRLWAAPVQGLRGWERRLALGLEWQAKAAYARLIEQAVGTMEPDRPTMKVHVVGLERGDVGGLPFARVAGAAGDGLVLEVDRYRRFTGTAGAIADMGGSFTEIAGNDDILLSVLAPGTPDLPAPAQVLREVPRAGFAESRYLVRTKVAALADLLRRLPSAATLEHIYDY